MEYGAYPVKLPIIDTVNRLVGDLVMQLAICMPYVEYAINYIACMTNNFEGASQGYMVLHTS